jgi:ketosteroid isomerase-like protein
MTDSASATGAEKNKRLLREQREWSQRHALPSALPGAPAFELQNPLSGFTPAAVTVSVDSPSTNPDDFMTNARGFPSQALGPTFLSFGPMIAERDVVVEEFESFIFGADGTLYNNQYCWILRFENDTLAEMREYNDSQHAAATFGPLGKWPALQPPTNPRRRNRHGGGGEVLADSDLESVFEVVDEFELDPRLLADVVPTPAAPPVEVTPGIGGNAALVRGLRKARAAGDPAVVGSFFAEGFRHFIAGESPFGWDHLPIAEIYAPLVEHLASPLTVRYGPTVADGDVVFEEMDIFARLDDGTVYNNWHAFVHEIRDGKIVQTREYLDTRHVWVVLGRWASWGDTPVPPRTRPRRSNLQSIAATTQTPTMFCELDRWEPLDPPLS